MGQSQNWTLPADWILSFFILSSSFILTFLNNLPVGRNIFAFAMKFQNENNSTIQVGVQYESIDNLDNFVGGGIVVELES